MVLQEGLDDRIENVLHTGMLDGVVGAVIVLVHCFEPPHVLQTPALGWPIAVAQLVKRNICKAGVNGATKNVCLLPSIEIFPLVLIALVYS